MTLAEIADLIKTVGFPIAVAAFVLVRLDKRLADVVKALEALNDPEKTAARLKPLLTEHRDDIVSEVDHRLRGVIHASILKRDAPL